MRREPAGGKLAIHFLERIGADPLPRSTGEKFHCLQRFRQNPLFMVKRAGPRFGGLVNLARPIVSFGEIAFHLPSVANILFRIRVYG
jgi:hypothetical protein